MKNYILLFFVSITQLIVAQDKVLVYYETNGYEHPSISNGIEMIEDLGLANGLWSTDSSEDSSVFNSSNLSNYKVVIWCNTSGNGLLTSAEQTDFENYIANGGGFVGIHAATDTYRDRSWPFYNDLVGAIVQTNPNHTSSNHNNTMDIVGEHADHQSVAFLGNSWNKTEEYYYWKNNGGQLYSGNNNLLIVRETGNNDYDEARPMSWYKEYMGGRSFYTALGHNASDYSNDQNFITHVEEGIKWAGDFGDPIPFEQVIANGNYYIQDVDLNLALETDDSTKDAYTNLVAGNNDGQIWSFEHQANDVYKIQNLLTDWYLETPQANCFDGANVGTWQGSTQSHHAFKVIKNGNEYILEPGHCSGKALSAVRSSNQENASLKNVNSSDNTQLWKLVAEEDVVLSLSDFEISAGKAVFVYPNPVNDVLTINGLIPELTNGLEVSIYDIIGNEVGKPKPLSVSESTIDFSHLSTGIYFVKYSNKAIPPQRIVKL